MGFGDAIAVCFQKYVVFSGRARRPEYWYFVLFSLLVGIAASIIDVQILGKKLEDTGPIELIVNLALFLPGLAVLWRRFHDVGYSGWLVLAFLVGIFVGALATGVGAAMIDTGEQGLGVIVVVAGLILLLIAVIWMIVILASRSQEGANQYGAEPPVGDS